MLRLALFLFGIVAFGQGAFPYRSSHPCDQEACFPPTQNLMIGRESLLKASSTCGLNKQERYCIVGDVDSRKKCFVCDSQDINVRNPAVNHRIENVVSRFAPGTTQRSWWQSEAGVQNVSIEFPFESEIIVTHVILTFKSPRPAAMLIEKSDDFGKTWQVYGYFAENCAQSFPGVSTGPQSFVGEAICESRYSSLLPKTEGEVIFRPLPRTLQISDPQSPDVVNHLKLTHLRIKFSQLHTLEESNYYALYDIVVRGSCSCNGHASACVMVGDNMMGQCVDCRHNTQGINCERCEDNYFLAGNIGEIDACQACNCNVMGSLSGTCDVNGQCSCRSGFSGRDCSIENNEVYGKSKGPQFFPWEAFYRFFIQGDK